MNKRRLSIQQQTRIAENQQRELQVNSDSSVDQSGPTAQNCNGRVISHYGQQLDVESLQNGQRGRLIRCHQRSNLPQLVTGDLVIWEADGEDAGVITALGHRSSLFGRPTAVSEFKPVAANIDRVLVVIAPIPEPFMNLIDRYLVGIECLGLKPLLVLNKVDVLNSTNSNYLDSMLSKYEVIGYPVFRVSAQTGLGLSDLEAALAEETTILVGQSGVGKSSLINSLGPDIDTEVGALSQGKAKGTHTTTTAKLIHLSSFDLVDSPGIREFSLGHIEPDRLIEGFVEMRSITGNCKFRDCAHQSEPDCAIQEAVANGQIDPQRLESYFQILQTLQNT